MRDGSEAPNVSQTRPPSLSVLQRLINKSISAAPACLAILCCHHCFVPPFPHSYKLYLALAFFLSLWLSHTFALHMEIKLRVVDAAYFTAYEGKDLLCRIRPPRRQNVRTEVVRGWLGRHLWWGRREEGRAREEDGGSQWRKRIDTPNWCRMTWWCVTGGTRPSMKLKSQLNCVGCFNSCRKQPRRKVRLSHWVNRCLH